MATSTAHSTAKMAEPSPLYLHRRYDAYECLGCGEMIEIPGMAVLKAGQLPQRVNGNPENLLCWREMMELDHAPCVRFTDAAMAEQARMYRAPLRSQ